MRPIDQIETRLGEIKSLSVGISRHLRANRGTAAREPAPIVPLVRGVASLFLAHINKRQPAAMAQALYPNDTDVADCTLNPARFLQRSVTNPALTGVPGWAAELVAPRVVGLIPILAPQSAYSILAQRGLRVSFDRNGGIIFPRRADSTGTNAAFIGEGRQIPVKQLGLSSGRIDPHKLAVISLFSAEISEYSTPNIETIIRVGLAEDVADAIDALLLSDTPPSADAPGGLLDGVTPLAATAGGGTAALAGDLGALAGAIDKPGDLVFLMPEAERVRAFVLAPGLAAVSIIGAALPAKTIAAVDAADFISAEGDDPQFSVSSQATVVTDDAVPVPTWGTPPTRDLFQENLTGVKMTTRASWALRRPGRVAVVGPVTW